MTGVIRKLSKFQRRSRIITHRLESRSRTNVSSRPCFHVHGYLDMGIFTLCPGNVTLKGITVSYDAITTRWDETRHTGGFPQGCCCCCIHHQWIAARWQDLNRPQWTIVPAIARYSSIIRNGGSFLWLRHHRSIVRLLYARRESVVFRFATTAPWNSFHRGNTVSWREIERGIGEENGT